MAYQTQNRQIRRRKKHRFLMPFLGILNVSLWGSAAFLWFQEVDVPPVVSVDFSQPVAILGDSVTNQPTVFDISQALTLEEVNLHIYSTHALLVNLNTGEIIFNYRGDERAYPASVTKIMAVLVGLEHARSDELIVNADFDELFNAGASMANLVAGDIRSLSEILHASMLESGADATSTLAYHVSDSYEAFVELMNETARHLGMHNTNFVNASGLHDDNHYTTAYDTAILIEYALNNEHFREVFTAPTYSFTNSDGNEQIMTSTMFSQITNNLFSPTFSNGEILGGKTGWTTPAGSCLASIATDGVDEFALITFGAGEEVMAPHIRDALAIYEYFFSLAGE